MQEESMSGPGFTPPDLCSIPTADEQDELAETACSGFSAAGSPPGDDDPPAPLTSGIDRAIRLSTAAAVLAVAGIAAYVSYWHAYAVVRAHGENGITARLEPTTTDGLVYASSMVVLYAARHRVPASTWSAYGLMAWSLLRTTALLALSVVSEDLETCGSCPMRTVIRDGGELPLLYLGWRHHRRG
jgi:hypothetical protein